MNEMGDALKALNRLAGVSERVNSGMINRQINKMYGGADRRDGGMDNMFKASIHDLVGDDIVERLLSGEKVEACLAGDGGDFMNMPFSPDVMQELSAMGFENDSLENQLNETMEYVSALESEL